MATITKRTWTNKSGKHEAWQLSYVDASGNRHREQFDKKRDADARRVEVEGQVRSGTFRPEAASTTVKMVCETFETEMKDRKDRGERVTEEYYLTMCGHLWNYIAPKDDRKNKIAFEHGIGDTKLSQLTARAVSEFRDNVRKAGVGVVTTRQILGTLSRVLAHAVSKDLVAINVASGIRVIGKRNEDAKKIIPPTKAAMAALIASAEGDFKVKVIFAAASGVRVSELHALRWKHVDLKSGSVTVETRVDSKRNEDTTKSAAGLRTIPLGATVVTQLKAWKLKTKFKKEDDLVFPNTVGNFENAKNMRSRIFLPALARAKVALAEKGEDMKEFGWHSLRHFAISTWIEANLTPKTVQTFAGHSSLSVTMDRYGHLFPSDDHRHTMDAIASSIFADGA